MAHARSLAFIPARGATQGLPEKHFALVGGQTLLERVISCARESAEFDDIVVSTDSAEIREAAERAGSRVPFLRPKHLAADPASILDVTLHALGELDRSARGIETITLLLPTSPLRTAEDVRAAHALYRASAAPVLMSVTAYEHTPLRAFVFEDTALMKPLHPEWLERLGAKARGKIPKIVCANGAIVIVDARALREHKSFYFGPIVGYEMPPERSVDIDTDQDLLLAQLLLQREAGASE